MVRHGSTTAVCLFFLYSSMCVFLHSQVAVLHAEEGAAVLLRAPGGAHGRLVLRERALRAKRHVAAAEGGEVRKAPPVLEPFRKAAYTDHLIGRRLRGIRGTPL